MLSLAKSPHGRYTRNKGEKHPLFSRIIISAYPSLARTLEYEKVSLPYAICGTPAFSATMPAYVKYLEGNMAKQNHSAYPITAGIRLLREKQVHFVPHLYPYQEHGGTHYAAEVLNVHEHTVIKTLVMMTDERHPLLILMHGDRSVSTKQLARILNVKQVAPCSEEDAYKYTGYLVGGISPFGTRTRLPVYAQGTIFSLEHIYINGGKHGFLLEISPADLHTALSVQEVDVQTDGFP